LPKKLTLEYVLYNLNKKYGDIFDFSLLTDYKGVDSKFSIICKICSNDLYVHVFQSNYHKLISRSCNCDSCREEIERIPLNKIVSSEQFFNDCKNRHGDKFDYSESVFVNCETKIKVICNKCKSEGRDPIIYTLAGYHRRKGACNKCSVVYKSNKQSLTQEQAIERLMAREKSDCESYDYSEVVYSPRDKIKIACNICKKECREFTFLQNFNDHCAGTGCPICKGIKNGNRCRADHNKLISDFIKVHGNEYDYNLVNYKNNKTAVTVICKTHGEFKISPKWHMKGGKCQQCHPVNKSVSRIEKDWLDLLGILESNRQRSVKLHPHPRSKRPDGINKEEKIVYEFLGDAYHGNPNRDRNKRRFRNGITFQEQYDQTKEKFDLYLKHGYKILYVWEEDYRKFLLSKIDGNFRPYIFEYKGGEILTYDAIIDIYKNDG
jgi:hypothetical protein